MNVTVACESIEVPDSFFDEVLKFVGESYGMIEQAFDRWKRSLVGNSPLRAMSCQEWRNLVNRLSESDDFTPVLGSGFLPSFSAIKEGVSQEIEKKGKPRPSSRNNRFRM